MANSTRKCCGCKSYFKAAEMHQVSPSAAWCTSQCKFDKSKKQQRAAIKSSFARKDAEPSVAEETLWLSRVTEFARKHGAFPNRLRNNPFQRHHVKGRKAVEKKVHIGRWFVLPVDEELHDVHSNDELNVTNFPRRFEETFGKQSMMFLEMCAVIKEEDGALPFGDEVLSVIEGL